RDRSVRRGLVRRGVGAARVPRSLPSAQRGGPVVRRALLRAVAARCGIHQRAPRVEADRPRAADAVGRRRVVPARQRLCRGRRDGGMAARPRRCAPAAQAARWASGRSAKLMLSKVAILISCLVSGLLLAAPASAQQSVLGGFESPRWTYELRGVY